MLNQQIYRSLTIAVLFLFFIYPVYFVVTRYINRKASELAQQVQQQSISLSKNQQRLDRALSTAKQAWFEMNLQTGLINVSDKYRNLLGVDKNIDFTLEFWQHHMHPDDRKATMAALQQCIDSSQTISVEFRRKAKPYGWNWTSAVGEIVEWDDNGKPLLLVGINRDITERKLNELALQTLAESGPSADNDIFKTIVRQLALSHNMRYAFIATVNADNTQATTLALWANGHFVDNISYNLCGSPCETITANGDIKFYPDNIQQLFPKDTMLVEMQARSYIGVPLTKTNGDVLGLISMLDDQPMIQRKQTIALLNSLAVRATIELERKKMNRN